MEHDHHERGDGRRPAAVREEQHQGHQTLHRGGEVGDETRQPAGPQVIRIALEHRPLERSRRDERVVGQHRRDHEREVPVELRGRRAQPDHHEHHLGPDDDVGPGEQEHQRQRRVHLAAGGQEDDLVAQAEHGQDRQDCDGVPARQHADLRVQSGYWAAAVGHQRDREQHEKDAVEQRVERGSVAALGHRHPVRPRWQPDGAGPQPVQDRSHRREVAPGQRAEAATEADDFEQHREQNGLLENDRFRPPGRDIGEAADASRGPRAQPGAEDVQRDLHAVHHVHDQRGAEPVLGDVARHRHDPFGARALAPLGHVDDGQVGLDEPHCSSFDKPGLKETTCTDR